MSKPRHHKAKLTPELVCQLRKQAWEDPSISLYALAEKAGVSRQGLTNALYGLCYKNLSVPPLPKYRRPKSREQHKEYVPKGDKRVIARRFLPGCATCKHFREAEGSSSCAAHRARTHIKSFPYKHTNCRYREEVC